MTTHMIVWWIGLAVGGAILSLNLHELAHCLIVWMIGGKVTGYKPWPHKADDHWFLGRMTWEMDRAWTCAECRWFYRIIPIKAAALLVLWLLLGLLCFLPLLALAFWELLDLGDWIKDYLLRRPKSDGGKFRKC